MRGFVRRGGTLASQFVCPACRHKITRDGIFCSSRLLPSRAFSRGNFRPSDTESDSSPSQHVQQKTGWQQLPRAERVTPFKSTHSTSISSKPSDNIGFSDEEQDLAVQKDVQLDQIHTVRDGGGREAHFYKTLRGRQPDLIMSAMLDPLNRDILCSLPETTFVDAFLLLSPKYFILPYREILHPLHPSQVHYRRIRDIDKIFSEFANSLGYIVRTRRDGGHNVGLEEYKHLMESAASMGDFPMADTVMQDMIIDKITPDLRCYNLYLEAMVWDNAYSGLSKYRLRVTPHYYRRRKWLDPGGGWEGYGTASRSVRKYALDVFREMTEVWIEGDVNTFASIFLASARVGHVRGMEGILKTVWNIDMDLLGKEGEAEHPPVISMAPSSPLYPNDYLLFAVAHGLACNNDMARAVRVVDFIARQYHLTIKSAVWRELLVRSYQYSKERFGPYADQNALGRVSPEFVEGIHNLMIASPYNVDTRMDEYRRFARSHWDALRLNEFKSTLDAAYRLLQKTRDRRKRARLVVEEYLSFPFTRSRAVRPAAVPDSILESPDFASALHDYDILRLLVQQQTVIMQRMVRLLFIQGRWTGRDNPIWERVILPGLLYEWRDFLPSHFPHYKLRGQTGTGGVVQIEGRPRRTSKEVRIRYSVDHEKPVEGDTQELDDDYLWQTYRKTLDDETANRMPLCRLFGDYSLPNPEGYSRKELDH